MIASAPREMQESFLDDLSDNALGALPYLFDFWAHPHQLPPEGNWRSWVILGGRGAGKTRAGAEWVRTQVESSGPEDKGRAKRVALVGETVDQVRDVMIFGDSGILACSPPDRTPVWEAGRKRLVWPNGAEAQVFSAHEPESLRGPQFDAAWCDEFGCAAIDKGTNEPNKFLDPKSSESALPKYSSGRRDDLIQMQALRAVLAYWADEERNPVSPYYGGRMLDTDRIFIWAWDARPYPYFPANDDLWSDAGNYDRGHWLNGRATARSLASVVREICARSGVTEIDVSELYGLVRGYGISEAASARAELQPLMLAYAADAMESDGILRFRNRSGWPVTVVGTEGVAAAESGADIEHQRLPSAETANRVRLTHYEADGDFEVAVAEVSAPGVQSPLVTETEFPLVLTGADGRRVAERWLAEARLGQERVSLGLPASMSELGAGDVIALDSDAQTTFRIDRVVEGLGRRLEAVRIERETYEPSDEIETTPAARAFLPALPVDAVFLDLPLLTGDEVAHAPHVAASAAPWPGRVAVYASADGESFALNTVVERPGVMGLTETVLQAADAGIYDRGPALRVRLTQGELSSVEESGMLSGANVAAVGSGSDGEWEVIQFRDAVPVGPNTFEISMRLRGQLGTDHLAASDWPIGSRFVLLDGAGKQIDLASSARGLVRTYRSGPAVRPVDHPVFFEEALAFSGIGLRPLSPVHLRAVREADGALTLSWIRRTRIDGDLWDLGDVPVGEAGETYQLRVLDGGTVVREETVGAPYFTYSAATQSADGLNGPFAIEVAQMSDRYGPGQIRRIEIDE